MNGRWSFRCCLSSSGFANRSPMSLPDVRKHTAIAVSCELRSRKVPALVVQSFARVDMHVWLPVRGKQVRRENSDQAHERTSRASYNEDTPDANPFTQRQS